MARAALTGSPGWRPSPASIPEWSAEGVAALRASVGADVSDPRRNELVAELSAGSDEFRHLWARHDAREKPSGRQRFRNDRVGVLELRYEPFAVSSSDRQLLYVFFAAPDSDTARQLDELARPPEATPPLHDGDHVIDRRSAGPR